MKDTHTFSEVSLTDLQFSRLLGISIAEFISLDRSELYAYVNAKGIIEEYFMYIHPDSPSHVLSKLNIEQHNFVRFSYSEIQALLAADQKQAKSQVCSFS